MAYVPIAYGAKDNLPSGDPNKLIRGQEIEDDFKGLAAEIERVENSSGQLASVKWNGLEIKYAYNVASVQRQGGGRYRINFVKPINSDGSLSAGDFASVLTPTPTTAGMSIGNVEDVRESWVQVIFKTLTASGDWVAPPTNNDGVEVIGFSFILVDQIPEI